MKLSKICNRLALMTVCLAARVGWAETLVQIHSGEADIAAANLQIEAKRFVSGQNVESFLLTSNSSGVVMLPFDTDLGVPVSINTVDRTLALVDPRERYSGMHSDLSLQRHLLVIRATSKALFEPIAAHVRLGSASGSKSKHICLVSDSRKTASLSWAQVVDADEGLGFMTFPVAGVVNVTRMPNDILLSTLETSEAKKISCVRTIDGFTSYSISIPALAPALCMKPNSTVSRMKAKLEIKLRREDVSIAKITTQVANLKSKLSSLNPVSSMRAYYETRLAYYVKQAERGQLSFEALRLQLDAYNALPNCRIKSNMIKK